MPELEFLILAVTEWQLLVLFSVISAAASFLAIRSKVVGGVFDPLMLAFVAGYSLNYAIVLFLYWHDAIRLFYVFLVLGYGFVLVVAFRASCSLRDRPALLKYVESFTSQQIGPGIFKAALAIYGILSFYIIASIGFGVFAEANRFESARGYGSFIRVLDCLGPFIVAYTTVSIAETRRLRPTKIIGLTTFILYAAVVSGAKIAVIFSLVTVALTLSIVSRKFTVRPLVALASMAVGLIFAAVALSINLERNAVEQDAASPLAGTNLVLERFVYRIIATGDTTYLTLPNDVIERLNTDNALVRFAAPLVGIGNLSNLLGYPVGEFSIGRQALLYHDPWFEVSGGPTSHFDFFAYVHFGALGGLVFVAALGFMLGALNRGVRMVRGSGDQPVNAVRVAWIATLWTRAVLLIVDPSIGLAYIIDVMIIFTLLSLAVRAVTGKPTRHWRAARMAA